MAGAHRLTSRSGRRGAALLAAVLLAHLAAVEWIGHELQATALLKPLAEPLFTRLLQQEAPQPPAAAATVTAAPARPAARPVPPAAPRPAKAASEPQQPEPEPEAAPAAEPATADAVPAEPVAQATPPQPSAPAPSPESAPPLAEAGTAATNLDSWPLDTRLNYRLGGVFRSGELHGDARVQWLRQEQRYEVRIDIDVTLLARLVMTSQGTVTPAGLAPEVYEEQRRNGVRRATLRGETILLGNGEVVPRPAGVQDTASQFVELSHRFASGREPLEVGRSITVWLARPGHLAQWTYDVVGRELLQTPRLGPVEAFHLKPRAIANPRGNITAEMWFAPSLQYLPVRIRVNMEPAYVDLVVDSIEQR